ncbi:GDP-mannose 4,6-dehydratase [bacterium]|nr:GDP-mannose 4,6-dehydratase [bacterium]
MKIDIRTGIDLLSWENLSHLDGFDIIVHLASKSFVPDSFNHPREFLHHNMLSTLHVLELARKNKARVIYMSSYLYGEPNKLPVDEEHPLKPHNPYATSKLAGEQLCRCYQSDFNVPVTLFRPFNIYGPGQNEAFLIPSIIRQMKDGHVELMDPRPKRDFVYVEDVVDAIALEIRMKREGMNIYNLGYGKSVSIQEIVDLLNELYGKPLAVHFKNEYRKNEILDIVADIGKIKSELGWQPKYSMRAGLNRILRESRLI